MNDATQTRGSTRHTDNPLFRYKFVDVNDEGAAIPQGSRAHRGIAMPLVYAVNEYHDAIGRFIGAPTEKEQWLWMAVSIRLASRILAMAGAKDMARILKVTS